MLIIFVKNPELGKVKTRLAKTVGDEKALEVYYQLLAHTFDITNKLTCCDKAVFYSEFINYADFWANGKYQKYLQEGNDLGETMLNSFALAFSRGYKNVVTMESDCIELSQDIIKQAFDMLRLNQVVIGPATDGGYYLLGMNKFYKEIFKNKEWSSENVLLDTLIDLKNNYASYKLLDTLSDVEEEKDWIVFKDRIAKIQK